MTYFRYQLVHALTYLLLLAAAVGLAGCSDSKASGTTGGDSESPRIVSLSPALSQVLLDLGQGDSIVGCTPWAPKELADVPVVGDLLEPNLERLIMVDPDLILIQPTRSGVDPDVSALAQQRGWKVVSWELNRLSDLDRVLEEMPDVLAGVGIDSEDARNAIAQWRLRRSRILVNEPVISSLGNVVVLFGVDPPQVFGGETYFDDVLRELGGQNGIKRDGYIELSLEDLSVLAPDSMIVLASGAEGAREKASTLRTGLGKRGEELSIFWVDGDDLLVPGTRLLDGIDTLKASLLEQQR